MILKAKGNVCFSTIFVQEGVSSTLSLSKIHCPLHQNFVASVSTFNIPFFSPIY